MGFSGDGRISFVEKPPAPRSDLAVEGLPLLVVCAALHTRGRRDRRHWPQGLLGHPHAREYAIERVLRVTAASSTSARVKGVAFRTIDVCYAELRGHEARDRAIDGLEPALRDGFRYRTLLASNWYSIEWYKACLRSFRAVRQEGPELVREIGKLAAKHDMAGVHKQLLAKLISPQALLGMAQRVFNRYYETGDFHIAESRPGFVRACCTGCLGWDENMWSELAGSCESLLEVAGAQHVRLRLTSGGRDGDDDAEFEARWV